MKYVATIVGIAALLTAGRASADDTGSLEGLLEQEVVTTASKSAEQGAGAPALVRNITAEEIRRYGMTTVSEALSYLGVGMYAQNRLGIPTMTVRGVAFADDKNDHVLLLLDGHVLNDPLFGAAGFGTQLAVPLEMIDHIELVLGPGSAVHGSNAVMAVVNVVTKSAGVLDGAHVAVEAGAVGTLRSTITSGHGFDFLGKRTGVTTGISYFGQRGSTEFPRENMGLDPSSGEPTRFSRSATGTGIWGGRATHDDYADALSAQLRVVRDGLEVMARMATLRLGDPSAIGNFDDAAQNTIEHRARLSVKQTISVGTLGEASVRVFGDALAARHLDVVSRTNACSPGVSTCLYRDAHASQRVGVEIQSLLDWMHDGKLTTSVGGVGMYEHVSADNGAFDADTGHSVYPFVQVLDVKAAFTVAGFVQQRWSPVSWLELNGGARLDWRTVADDGGDYRLSPVASPRAVVAVKPWEGATLKAIYAKAFRAPSLYELDAASPILLHSVHLQPEHTTTKEIVLEQQLGRNRLMFGAFKTDYEGLISPVVLGKAEILALIAANKFGSSVYDPSLPLSQYQSSGSICTRGFNAGVDSALVGGRLRLAASVTGSVARANDGEELEVAPRVSGNARASYDLGGPLPTVAVASTFAGPSRSDLSQDRSFPNEPRVPSQLELRATVTGRVPHARGLSYRLVGVHTFNPTTPFAVGPALRGSDGINQPYLAPTKRWNAILGLQYDF